MVIGVGNNSCLENPMDRGSLESYSPWDHKELDTTEQLGTAQHSTYIISLHCKALKNRIIQTEKIKTKLLKSVSQISLLCSLFDSLQSRFLSPRLKQVPAKVTDSLSFYSIFWHLMTKTLSFLDFDLAFRNVQPFMIRAINAVNICQW